MKQIAFLLVLMSSFLTKAQEASSRHNANTLQNKLSVRVLNAYQENASSKIEDVFHYFQLLTDNSLNSSVKKEIILNINLIFNNQNPIIIDITSETFDKIELKKLIQKLQVSAPMSFEISYLNQYNAVTFNSWINKYSILRTKSGLTKCIDVNQTVFMEEEIKEFGGNSKEVWVTYLGEINR